MIHYNMRYKGAYEYEKFALNIFQYSNDSNFLLDELFSDDDFQNLKETHREVNEIYNRITSSNSIGEKMYKSLLMFKED